MDTNTILKIVIDRIKAIEAEEFQLFCDRLLRTLYPDDFTPVRAGGRYGDMKNDGYCYLSRKFFQAHASRGEKIFNIETKIKHDLTGCVENQRDVKEFVYITNDTMVGKVENFIDGLRPQFPGVKIETWGPDKIAFLIKGFPVKDISYIIDRNLPEDQVNGNSYLLLVESEKNDLGIIDEIFEYIFQKLKATSFKAEKATSGKVKLKNLREKIMINFDGSQQKTVKGIFNNNWERKALVEQYVQQQMDIDETSIFALIDLIQHEYLEISDVEDIETPIKDFTIFEKIGCTFLPAEKQKNPDYISNAKAIVLHFFEFCEIGKKTVADIGRSSQRDLFEGLE